MFEEAPVTPSAISLAWHLFTDVVQYANQRSKTKTNKFCYKKPLGREYDCIFIPIQTRALLRSPRHCDVSFNYNGYAVWFLVCAMLLSFSFNVTTCFTSENRTAPVNLQSHTKAHYLNLYRAMSLNGLETWRDSAIAHCIHSIKSRTSSISDEAQTYSHNRCIVQRYWSGAWTKWTSSYMHILEADLSRLRIFAHASWITCCILGCEEVTQILVQCQLHNMHWPQGFGICVSSRQIFVKEFLNDSPKVEVPTGIRSSTVAPNTYSMLTFGRNSYTPPPAPSQDCSLILPARINSTRLIQDTRR